MTRTILGARIRERRRTLGIKQAHLARTLGISPSYLNLIEHNKRGIAGALLLKAAEALGLKVEELDGAAERRLLEALYELAHNREIADLGVETESVGELIGRYPGWARAIAALARSQHEATIQARALADRLTHDPYLEDVVHKMLTRTAAVRSASQILADYDDIDAQTTKRFHSIIDQESNSLAQIGEALAAYFDKAESTDLPLTPLDEVESMFDAHENHFEELERAVAELAPEHTHLIPGQRQQWAEELARNSLSALVDDIVGTEPLVVTSLAKGQAKAALLTYATQALLAPMSAFEPQAQALRYDIEALAQTFSIGAQTVCHRLSALPTQEHGPKFGYLQANAAGTIVEIRNLPGLVVPRYSSACPLWALYRTQQSPEAIIRQRTLFPSGARFIFVARARNTGPTGFGKPRHYLTDMLTMTELHATQTVYAPDTSVPVEPVGSACRSCPRRECWHRVNDPLAG
ncbi:MAG: putative transcriptional regulator/transcriptional regulator with XRE-family HTH domain [Gammaproteobacteria bacterium]|jgi:predicted transcriptional regulator/transcriptional regulator with XRE-family HTH domain